MSRIVGHKLPPRRDSTSSIREDTVRPTGHPDNASAVGGGSQLSPVEREQIRKQLESLAWLLDESIRIPGLNFRIGLDGLIGLIPGIGDLFSTGLSSYIIRQAARLGVPKVVLLRMSFNAAVDFLLGLVPFLGDLADFGWKANRMNVNLVLEHLDNPGSTNRSSWGLLIGSVVAILAAAGLIVFAIASLLALLL